jgi:hypothetical protein
MALSSARVRAFDALGVHAEFLRLAVSPNRERSRPRPSTCRPRIQLALATATWISPTPAGRAI